MRQVKPSWMSANHIVDAQTRGREGTFRGKIKNPKEPEKSCLQQRQEKKEIVNTFLSGSEKQAVFRS